MALSNLATADAQGRAPRTASVPATDTLTGDAAVSWGAIVAGAAAAAALSLILLVLGIGLGLSSVSPWTSAGITATTFGISAILWVTFTQLVASGMGGYLAGRLRTKWVAAPTDEVYFRDTAHGFLAWAVASLATAALLTSAVGSILSTGIQAGASATSAAVTAGTAAASGAAAMIGSGKAGGEASDTVSYFVDTLFRKDMAASPAAPAPDQGGAATSGTDRMRAARSSEAIRIFANAMRSGVLPPDDLQYLGQVVTEHTGLSQQAAAKRVSDTFATMQAKLRDTEAAVREAADKARKASAYASLWLFVALLAGAFMASLAATFGGRQRDA